MWENNEGFRTIFNVQLCCAGDVSCCLLAVNYREYCSDIEAVLVPLNQMMLPICPF